MKACGFRFFCLRDENAAVEEEFWNVRLPHSIKEIIKISTLRVPFIEKPLKLAYNGVILSSLHYSVMEYTFSLIDRNYRNEADRV